MRYISYFYPPRNDRKANYAAVSYTHLDVYKRQHFGLCGGCIYQSLPYEEQLKIKEGQVRSLLDSVVEPETYEFQGIKASPAVKGYRNKMEFSFGDEMCIRDS